MDHQGEIASKARVTFLASKSHEIRTRLFAITCLDYLVRTEGHDSDIEQCFASELAVIVAQGDTNSEAIATYYQNARGISAANTIRVAVASGSDTLSATDFALLKADLDAKLPSSVQATLIDRGVSADASYPAGDGLAGWRRHRQLRHGGRALQLHAKIFASVGADRPQLPR